jgi:hypothetical protein
MCRPGLTSRTMRYNYIESVHVEAEEGAPVEQA